MRTKDEDGDSASVQGFHSLQHKEQAGDFVSTGANQISSNDRQQMNVQKYWLHHKT